MKRKRYGVILEYLEKGVWKYLRIEYFNSLKKAEERKNYINNNCVEHRAYGIFDYEKATYKYIINEEKKED